MCDEVIPAGQAPAKEPYNPPLLTRHRALLALTGKSPEKASGEKITTEKTGDKTTTEKTSDKSNTEKTNDKTPVSDKVPNEKRLEGTGDKTGGG